MAEATSRIAEATSRIAVWGRADVKDRRGDVDDGAGRPGEIEDVEGRDQRSQTRSRKEKSRIGVALARRAACERNQGVG